MYLRHTRKEGCSGIHCLFSTGEERMLKRNVIGLLAAVALGSSVFAVGAQDATPESTLSAAPAPDTITINVPSLQPEGIEYDAMRGQFLVGSISQSSVSVVG